MPDLFEAEGPIELAEDAYLVPGYLARYSSEMIPLLRNILRMAPLRRMQVPGGGWMTSQISGCGQVVWVSDLDGYRYSTIDPLTGRAWPEMPDRLHQLAVQSAAVVGFTDFSPDCCLINCYRPGTGMGLHRDKDERDFSAPIVSFSLGIPAVFLFGGHRRRDPVSRVTLEHGDLVVWGGKSRLYYHGIAKLANATHSELDALRINLTFREALST